jgi:exodeoxyribonuclease-5
MELTKKQEEGLKIILQRHRNNEKYTTVAGYAGTCKSTLVKFAIAALEVEESKVAYATYTGKAAEVLRKKGNSGACTLHKLLYEHAPLEGGGFFRRKKPCLDVDIVVVDEVSMVPKTMVDLLLTHKVYIIFLGDPFQLPQIDKNEDNHLLDNPHVFLDEIMRQAAESEIIQLTMAIREGKEIKPMRGKEVIVLPRKELTTGCLNWADQTICFTNATRLSINSQVREMLGYSGLPKDGERIICLKNYWDDCNYNNDALVNGTTGIIKNPFETFRRIPYFIKNDRHDLPIIQGDFYPDGSDGYFSNVEIDKEMIMQGTPCIDWRVSYQLGKLKEKYGEMRPREFDFAYALTCWKAQGSEWPNVLVIEEKFPFNKLEHARGLYTACTRAEEKLVLVLKE